MGQSYLACERVWQPITEGFKARSVVGRFVLGNWPSSLRFTIELWSAQADRYAPPSAPLRCSRSLNKLVYEAQRAVQADERRAWSTA